MAKLKAPLMSLGARSQLGKALVFFPWKGIDAVREYVVPANPNTAAQATQRGYVTSAVTEWHGAAYNAADNGAWNRLAGIAAKIMSGFNRMVQEFVNEAILGNTWTRIGTYETAVITATTIAVGIAKATGAPNVTVRWGTRKTFFPNSAVMTDDLDGTWSYTITGLVSGQLYYITFDVGTSGADWGRTGIYQERTS